MPKLPVLKPGELLKALFRAGFYIHHQTGSHARLLHHQRNELRATVPIHSTDIPQVVLKSILRQADLTPDQLLQFLK